MLEYVKATRKKTRIFYSQADRKRCSPPPLRSPFFDFYFGVLLALSYDNMFSETDFTQEKVNFIQLLETPIHPLTAAALWMIICTRPALHFDNHEKGMTNFETLHS